MTSRTTRSISGFSASTRPVSPSCASTTSCPSRLRLRRTPRAIARSSSITSTRGIARVCSAQTSLRGTSRSRGGGELDAEDGAAARTALHVDAAAVRFHEPLGDGEAQTRPLGAAGEKVVGAVEALEDALAVLLAHADSVVFHLDGHPVIGGAPR